MSISSVYTVFLATALLLSITAVVISYVLISEIREGLSAQGEMLSSLQSDVSELRNRISLLSTGVEDLRVLAEGLGLKYSELSKGLGGVKYPFMLTDSAGRTVFIRHEPVRVVSVGPAITEILFAIGVGDRVVGVDRFSNYPPILNELINNDTIKLVGDAYTLNIELVISLRPDVVFLTYSAQLEKYIKILSDLGVTVYVIKVDEMSDTYNALLTLGLVMNKVEESLKLVEEITNSVIETYMTVNAYLNKTRGTKVSVYWEVFPEYWTLGGNTFQNDIVEYAGGVNVFANTSMTWFTASPESVINLNPSVILISYNYGVFGSYQDLIDGISSRPGWGSVTAVKDGRIYVIGGHAEDVLSRPGPRVALGVEILARVLYPKAFNLTQVPNFIDDEVVTAWGLLQTHG